MSTKAITISFSIIIFLLLILYLVWGSESGTKQLELDSTKNKVLSEVQKAQEYVDKASKWSESEGVDSENAYFHPPDVHDQNDEPKTDVLEYFIAGLLANDLDIFLSSFYTESLSKDLFQSNVSNKEEVAKEIMQRISRNGQIVDVEYVIKRNTFSSEANKISVKFVYEDGKKAKVNLDILPVTDSHDKEEISIYVITTSAWNIIEQIENSINN